MIINNLVLLSRALFSNLKYINCYKGIVILYITINIPYSNMTDIPSPRQSDDEIMYVITRTGKKEELNPNCITTRLRKLINKHPKINHVNPFELMKIVTSQLIPGISTYEIDEHAANAAASLSIDNPEYLKLASRIVVDNHQKTTDRSFVDKMRRAYLRKDDSGKIYPLLSEKFFKYVEEYQDIIEPMINYERDFTIGFFGFKTILNLYSMKIGGKPIERPQDVFMRVAVAINMNLHFTSDGSPDLDTEFSAIRSTYDAISTGNYTAASPVYFNSGHIRQQLASCFLMGSEDSLEGIKESELDAARISKYGGGIGVHVNCWRSSGSLIRGTNGRSSGIVPFLQIRNANIRAFNQGGRRNGSEAVYLMPHHPDISQFLKLKLPTGQEEERARDLFYAVWLPNIFMERVRDNAMWSLFDPNDTVDLSNYYDEKEAQETNYTAMYLKLEEAKRYKYQVPARTIWKEIYECNMLKGMPYICFSDHSNQMSNQKNLGTVKSSNLCVSADTMILTTEGYQPIKTLTETNKGIHTVWNGFSWSKAQFAQTGVGKTLQYVIFNNGVTLECTAEHKFMLDNGAIVLAKDLKPGMQLKKCYLPVVDSKKKENCQWLSEYIEHAGTITDSTFTSTKQITNAFLRLQELSVESQMHDGKLIINVNGLQRLHGLGVRPKNMPKYFHEIQIYDSSNIITVKQTGAIYGTYDTYCFNEPSNHTGMFNGILAMNCSEIILYSDHKETAVCNLSSICLPNFVEDSYTEDETRDLNHEFPQNPVINYQNLINCTKLVTTNINHMIDVTFYPTEKARRSNLRHRPIGIGGQGLADVYAKMRFPYASKEARTVNIMISITMYYASVSQSTRLARELYKKYVTECKTKGSVTILTYKPDDYEDHYVTYTDWTAIPKTAGSYPSMTWNGGAPISHGIFHWELYGKTEEDFPIKYDWETLREHVKTYGVRNSQFIALMPTATSSIIMGNNESFEPYTSNIYKRKTLTGEFIVINKWLMNDLYRLGLWNNMLKEYLIASEGSVQYIDGLDDRIKELYKTAWEIDPEELIQQAIDRQPFVDQAQSLNWYIATPTYKQFTELAFKAWKGKLKTAKYYMHSRPSASPQKFSIDPELQKTMYEKIASMKQTQVAQPTVEICDLCSS